MTPIHVFVDERMFQGAGEPQRKKLRRYAKRLREQPFLGDRMRRGEFP